MASPHSRDVTALLHAWSQGDRAALDELVPIVYDELRQRAARQMRQQSPEHTLRATALVHETYLRLAGDPVVEWQSRAHFFGVAAKVMRSVLVDHERARRTAKRGGVATRVTLGAASGVADTTPDVDVLALDEALVALAELDPDKCRIVELRYFAGLTIEETAAALGISPATVKREWAMARAWLRRELREQ